MDNFYGYPSFAVVAFYVSYSLRTIPILFVLQMLDRYEQHTLKCSSCKSAYKTFETLQKFLIGVVVCCSATAGIPSDIRYRIILGALAIVSAGLAYTLFELQKNFVFVDYVHAEIED